jgi:hypothetical protein
MTQRLKSLQQDLLSTIGLGIGEFGFDSRPKGQSFLRVTSFGRVSLHLSFIKHPDDFDVTADVGIRFDDVQELVTRHDKSLRPAEKADTYTLGIELGNLAEGKQKRWTIRTLDDVSGVARSILTTFDEFGLRYIERYSDEGNALDILSRDDREAWRHMPFHDERAKRAVAMALLKKGRDAAQGLARAKLAFLHSQDDSGCKSFREFLSYAGLDGSTME